MSGETEDDTTEESELSSARERLEEGADKAIGEFDQGVVDLLAWLLDTETRARIYVYLRQHPDSTSEEVAEGTGLYPSTVREALAELHDEETVSRGKRESEGAGNNPYEYEAISPSDLVAGAVGQVQSQLNAVFNLDEKLTRDDDGEEGGPVTISVKDAADDEASDADANTSDDDDATDDSDADRDDAPENE
ncbi:MAG: helix-turn-helix domain-containing protein [Haloferacaceae archaeon]